MCALILTALESPRQPSLFLRAIHAETEHLLYFKKGTFLPHKTPPLIQKIWVTSGPKEAQSTSSLLVGYNSSVLNPRAGSD